MLDYSLIHQNDKILVAVSGGMDSMVLLHLLHQIPYIELGVVHVNYRLRQQSADLDEDLVLRVAKKMRIPYYLLHPDTTQIANNTNQSIQEVARHIRYDYFDYLCYNHDYNKIATAHHLNDQIETFLFNLLRGAGMQGLQGIPRVKKNIIRPLLEIEKDQIRTYASEHQLPYREDATNAESKYTRNYIRNKILPLFPSINSQYKKHIQQTMQDLSQSHGLLNWFIEEKLSLWQTVLKDQIILDLALLPKEHYGVLLYELLKPYRVNRSLIQDIQIAFEANRSGAQFITKSHTLTLNRNQLIIKTLSKKPRRSQPITLFPGLNQVPGGTIIIQEADYPDHWPSDQNTIYISREKIIFPLILRNWQPGDKMAPLGMNGQHQKIQDILTNQKVSRVQKEQSMIMEQSGDIIWLVGHKMSELFKLSLQDKALRITFQPH